MTLATATAGSEDPLGNLAAASLGRATPFLKWAGGKTRMLDRLLRYAPPTVNNYFEPFLGGGALFFALQPRVLGRCYLSDLNSELINVWLAIRNRHRELLSALERFRGYDGEDQYYAVRAEAPDDPIERAARFLYLNQTAWNGLWRVNKQGIFNVPWGARPFRGLDERNLHLVRRACAQATVRQLDFRESLRQPNKGDFVYLDPPYLPISDTSKFNGYNGQRFRDTDLRDLADCCRELTRRGVPWVLSNRDNSHVRELFSDSDIHALTTRRSVAAQNRRDVQPRNSPDVIVTNWEHRTPPP